MVWNLKKVWLPAMLAALLIPACAPAVAQTGQPPRPPMQKKFHMPFGRWWDNPHMAQRVGLTSEQQKKMDAILLQYRPKLMELHATLDKEQQAMWPLIGARHLNEGAVLAQINVVVGAHANLEREFDRYLFAIRRQLTYEQWQRLRAIHQEHMKHRDWHHGPPPPPGGGPPRM